MTGQDKRQERRKRIDVLATLALGFINRHNLSLNDVGNVSHFCGNASHFFGEVRRTSAAIVAGVILEVRRTFGCNGTSRPKLLI